MSILTYSESLFEIPICTHKFLDFPHNNHTLQDMENRRNAIDMRATGIVRRIDDLGRVVVPKEIRRRSFRDIYRPRGRDHFKKIFTDRRTGTVCRRVCRVTFTGNRTSGVHYRQGSCDRGKWSGKAGI